MFRIYDCVMSVKMAEKKFWEADPMQKQKK